MTPAEVGEVLVHQARASFGATAAWVSVLVDAGRQLDLLAQCGYAPDFVEAHARIPMTAPLAVVEVVRSLEERWLESTPEHADRYPELELALQATRGEALAVLPLTIGRRAIGFAAFRFPAAGMFGPDDREPLRTLVRQASEALERARLYELEQEARRAAEAANERLAQLHRIAEIGLASRSLEELLGELLDYTCELFGADRATVFLVDEDTGDLVARAFAGEDGDGVARLRIPAGHGFAGLIAASGESPVVGDVIDADSAANPAGQRGSLAGVPLRAEGRTLGVLTFGSARPDVFADADLRLLRLLAGRAALAVERTMLYEREHRIAETLQRSMMPDTLPEVEGIALACRYLPGSNVADVGGDWYDVIVLPEGRLGVVVGDVVGKGVLAASSMGQLRNALRAYALEGFKPSAVLQRLNRLAETVGAPFATAVYLVHDPGRGVCRYASAGHPPPLLLRPGGPAEYLEGGRSMPLGVAAGVHYRQEAVKLEPGSTILLYTDGLVESRTRTIDEGLNRLREAALAAPRDLEELLDLVVHELLGPGERGDDVAIVALRVLPVPASPAVPDGGLRGAEPRVA